VHGAGGRSESPAVDGPPREPDGAGSHKLSAKFTFSTGETQTDTFDLQVVAGAGRPRSLAAPRCSTRKARHQAAGRLGVAVTTVAADADLAGFDLLLVGKGA